MSGWDQRAVFEEVDWQAVGHERSLPPAEVLTLILGGLLLASFYAYVKLFTHGYIIDDWRMGRLQWVFLLGWLSIISFGVVPALKRWSTTKRYLRYLLSRPVTAFSLIFVAILVFVGLFGPVLMQSPGLRFDFEYTPPVGFTTEISPFRCGGTRIGEAFDSICQGTWDHPLGTNHRGHPIEYLLMTGARITMYVVVFTAGFIVPIAVATGIIAGLRGGWVDSALMSYVDIQLSLPAIIVYFVGYMYWNVSLLLLLVTFGLLSWGGIARLVRSEVLQRREEGHVMVARGLGASEAYVAVRHILPNVSNTVLPAMFHLLAMLVLIEAGIAFLGFHEIGVFSWGSTIAESVNSVYSPGLLSAERNIPTTDIWWASTFPALVLALTMFSFKVLGDGLRDAMDRR